MWETATRAPAARTAADPATPAYQAGGLRSLQQAGGNRAVAALVSRLAVQRDDPKPADPAAAAGAAPAASAADPGAPVDHGLKPEDEQPFVDEAAKISPTLDADVGSAAPAKTAGADTSGAGGNTFKPWFYDLQAKLSRTVKWGANEVAAQSLLTRYVTAVAAKNTNGPLPPNVKDMLDYLGSGKANVKAANTAEILAGGKDKTLRDSGHFGGTAGGSNWCTGTTSIGVLDGLKSMNYATTPNDTEWFTFIQNSSPGKTVGAPTAYTAPLRPGDMVMFLFKGCQYGGHTVTVLDDLGSSFTHVSGNTNGRGGASSVGAGESVRRKDAGKLDVGIANGKDHDAANAEIKAHAADWADGEVLTYSVTSYAEMFAQLDELRLHFEGDASDVEAWKAQRKALAAKWHLRVIDEKQGPPAAPAAPAGGTPAGAAPAGASPAGQAGAGGGAGSSSAAAPYSPTEL